MLRFLKVPLSITASIAAVYLVAFCLNKRRSPPIIKKRRNPNGKYRAYSGWEGTPSDSKERFVNHQYPFYQNYVDILNWIPSHAINLIKNRNKKFLVLECQMEDLVDKENILVWLGHASFFIKLSRKTFLIDPHFNDMFPYIRHSKNPIKPEQFTAIDYILISHDHADHLDKRSILQLAQQNPEVTVLTGLKMDEIIERYAGISHHKIKCADWFEEYSISEKDISIHFVPTRHYCKRIDSGFNKALWGGFIIECRLQTDTKTVIFFGGDSGYGSHYKMINTIYKPDFAIMGIGAYAPRWFMEPNHMNIPDVVRAFKETGATTLIPMHYSTFNLSSEDMDEPLKKIKQLAGADLTPLTIGEVYYLV
jgi:L-ascorbate metabolism protein UlaG (beta-lactamase superfamily)